MQSQQETPSNETIDIARLSLLQLLARVPLSQLGGFSLAVGAAIAGAATLGHYVGQDKRDAAMVILNNGLQNAAKESQEAISRVKGELSQCMSSKQNLCVPLLAPPAGGAEPTVNIEPDATQGDSCAILSAGNARYNASKFEQAIATYRSVERVDQNGKSPCTGSIYASIASSFTILADRSTSTDLQRAAAQYRLASSYNRAFAYAVACNLGSCDGSAQHWSSPR